MSGVVLWIGGLLIAASVVVGALAAVFGMWLYVALCLAGAASTGVNLVRYRDAQLYPSEAAS